MKKDAITVNEFRQEPLETPRNWEPLAYVDSTPDENYVFRILEAHLENCKVRWVGTNSELVQMMNETCEKREQLLKQAIEILKR